MARQRVTDHGPPRKYWTQVPNLVDDSDLDPYARTLYMHYLRIAGQRDELVETVRDSAAKCHMSLGAVLNARKRLVDDGWIELEDVGTYGRGAELHIHILDRWGENMSRYHDSPRTPRNVHVVNNSEQEAEECSPGEQSVHVVNNSAGIVHEVNNSFHHVNNSISDVLLKKEKQSTEEKEKPRAHTRDRDSKTTDVPCEQCGGPNPHGRLGLRLCRTCIKGDTRARASPAVVPA